MKSIPNPMSSMLKPVLSRLNDLRLRRLSAKRYNARRIVTEQRITDDVNKLGVREGDVLYVHSSLKSLGLVKGGPKSVINALIHAVGPNGTLVMPCFSIKRSMRETLESQEIFDPRLTPSTIGLIAETFRNVPGAIRSIHPTHSICALGAKAEWITVEHHKCSTTFGQGTPYWKMLKLNAKILGLGVSLAYPTFYHTFEDLTEDFPLSVYEKKEYAAKVIGPNGAIITMKLKPHSRKIAATRIDTQRGTSIRRYVTHHLVSHNRMRLGLVGDAHSWLLGAQSLLDSLRELMHDGITIYTPQEELRSRSSLPQLVRKYQSSHSEHEFDYLKMQIEQTIQLSTKQGFWDAEMGGWIGSLTWNGLHWKRSNSGYSKYSLELQEGATFFALTTKNRTLDDLLSKALESLHDRLQAANSNLEPLITDREPVYQTGILLSVLALGVTHFKRNRSKTAKNCQIDMLSVLDFIRSRYSQPEPEEGYAIILRGLANTSAALADEKVGQRGEEVKELLNKYASRFLDAQSSDGSFQEQSPYQYLQIQEKIDIALLLAYRALGIDQYLVAVKRNIEWMLAERWVGETGALAWYSECDLYFECHQLWFNIIAQYMYQLTDGKEDYLNYARNAWLFLTDNNYAHLDTYVDNYIRSGAFFSYRGLKENGEVQTDTQSRSTPRERVGRFKGAYEIGTALWSLALNYNL